MQFSPGSECIHFSRPSLFGVEQLFTKTGENFAKEQPPYGIINFQGGGMALAPEYLRTLLGGSHTFGEEQINAVFVRKE